MQFCFFFFSSRRRHTRCGRDWSSDVCSSEPRPRRAEHAVRGPHRRQHLALAVANLPTDGGERLGSNDAVGGDAEEDVALDHLQVKQPAGDDEKRDHHHERERARPPPYLWKLGVLPGYLHLLIYDPSATSTWTCRRAARAPGRPATGPCRLDRPAAGTATARTARRSPSAPPRAAPGEARPSRLRAPPGHAPARPGTTTAGWRRTTSRPPARSR